MWKKIKIIVGILCFITAVILAVQQYSTFHPPLEFEMPESTQDARYRQQLIEQEFIRGIELLGLTKKQREQLDKWLQWKPQGKSAEEKRAHEKELQTFLDEEQVKRFRELRIERNNLRKTLKEERDKHLREMLGAADYERNKADMQRVAEQRRQRLEQQRATGN